MCIIIYHAYQTSQCLYNTVIDMHCYQPISLIQDMVIVDVMKPQNNYIMYLTDIIIAIIIVNSCISNTTYITTSHSGLYLLINDLVTFLLK